MPRRRPRSLNQPCGYCDNCTLRADTAAGHPAFELDSEDPVNGINMMSGMFSARQITDAFAPRIPGHMDWPIKRNALARWRTILPELQSGLEDRIEEFDLEPVFEVFNDVLFLGLLRDSCHVVWVDREGFLGSVGQYVENFTLRGPASWIQVVRPSRQHPRTVQDVLDTLLHEMSHALLSTACECRVCDCVLNVVKGKGLKHHGPIWDEMRYIIEDTANTFLTGFEKPFRLCYSTEPQRQTEEIAEEKAHHSLSKKLERHNDVSEKVKVEQRARKYREKEPYTREESDRYKVWCETLEYLVAMLK